MTVKTRKLLQFWHQTIVVIKQLLINIGSESCGCGFVGSSSAYDHGKWVTVTAPLMLPGLHGKATEAQGPVQRLDGQRRRRRRPAQRPVKQHRQRRQPPRPVPQPGLMAGGALRAVRHGDPGPGGARAGTRAGDQRDVTVEEVMEAIAGIATSRSTMALRPGNRMNDVYDYGKKTPA